MEITVSFSEKTKGWTSFKSFIPENGLSMSANYYTFKRGKIYKHNEEGTIINPHPRNNFYNIQYKSSVNVLLNDSPSSIKSFNTLNYEGSASKVNKTLQYDIVDITNPINVTNTINDPEYHNLQNKTGWYVTKIETDKQEGSLNEFIEKEGKWFNYIRGKAIETNIDGTLTNDFDDFDTSGFAIQGIGKFDSSNVTTLNGCTCDGTVYDCFAVSTTWTQDGCTNTIYTDQASCIAAGVCTGEGGGAPFSTNETDCIANNINESSPGALDGAGTWTAETWGPVNLSTYTGQAAYNYNPNANVDDGSCYPVIPGCTNPIASNYITPINNVYYDVNTDDGSCIHLGCTCNGNNINGAGQVVDCSNSGPTTYSFADPSVPAFNYDPSANTDNGTCIETIYGCTDQQTITGSDGNTYNAVTNFNSSANVDDGSCIPTVLGCTLGSDDCYDPNANTDYLDQYEPNYGCCGLLGCIDPTAFGYDPTANVDDGSCLYCGDPNADNYDFPTSDPFVSGCLYCEPPSNLQYTVTSLTPTSVEITWDAPTIGAVAQSYYISILNQTSFFMTPGGTSTTTSKVITNLLPGNKYQIIIRTVCENTVSGWMAHQASAAASTHWFTTPLATDDYCGDTTACNYTGVGTGSVENSLCDYSCFGCQNNVYIEHWDHLNSMGTTPTNSCTNPSNEGWCTPCNIMLEAGCPTSRIIGSVGSGVPSSNC